MVEAVEKMNEKGALGAEESPALAELFTALRRLDRLLERAVVAANEAFGAASQSDRFRGLHISPEEVARLLARDPAAPTFHIYEPGPERSFSNEETSRLVWLADSYGLSQFDLDLLLIALAPELDLRYERLYAYLQDDVSRQRPSVDLALNLLCPTAGIKIGRRAHLAPEAPLVRHGLIHLLPDANRPVSPNLAHYLKVDEQIVRWLLGERSLDSRLISFSDFVSPGISLGNLSLNDEIEQTFRSLIDRADNRCRAMLVYLQGAPGAGQRQIAEAMANETGLFLLAADLSRAVNATVADFDQLIRLLFREAYLQNTLLFLNGIDAMHGEDRMHHRQSLLESLSETFVITLLSGRRTWESFSHDGQSLESKPLGVMTVRVPSPDFEQRRSYWRSKLSEAEIELDGEDLNALSGRFRLDPDRIADAITAARNRYDWTDASIQSETSITSDERIEIDWFGRLQTAARQQSSQDLMSLALKIEPHYSWSDIVLPDDTFRQLREICARVTNSHEVLGKWGFGNKLAHGKGVSALFAGPSGTGKTMAADIIANELVLDLYKIDLAGVVSKYIGETEKNLDRIFTAAENANAILFFDEADALFGKRFEVQDSHDRYANIEISYLLQKMEQYEGVAILATNLRQNLDDAFVRRLAFTVHFPFPDEADRRRIWEGIWPRGAHLGNDVEFGFLARQFKLSGGNIKNIALASAFLAAADGGVVTMEHLSHATQREYQKLGKVLSAAELYGSRKEARRS
jgi:SpoVK/Ycf46/Vps4 family AAA+-type ATPase